MSLQVFEYGKTKVEVEQSLMAVESSWSVLAEYLREFAAVLLQVII